MTDPERLLDEGANALELDLLRAGEAEGPSVSAQRATLAALGLGSALLSTSPAAAAGLAATGARAALLKWWAAGAIAAAAVGGSYWALSGSTQASGPPTGAAPNQPVSAPLASPVHPSPDAPAALPSEAQPRPSASAPISGPRTVAPASSSTPLQEQIALIDRARTAAASGQPAATLAALDEYAKRFPQGALYQEATMLRIEALLARGDRTAAQALGRRFLRDHPRSALSPRVRQLIGD